MYGSNSSYTKQDLDQRSSEFKRQKQEKLEERVAQRAAEIVMEKMKKSEDLSTD